MILKTLLIRLTSIGKTIHRRNLGDYPVSEFNDYMLRDIGLRREEGKIVSRFDHEWESVEPDSVEAMESPFEMMDGPDAAMESPARREARSTAAARATPAGQPSRRCPRCGAAVT